MNVSLTPELEKFIHDKVASGMYSSASEVVREAIRGLHERDLLDQIKLEELRKDIQIGLDQLDRGEFVRFDRHQMMERVLQRIAAEKESQRGEDEWHQATGS